MIKIAFLFKLIYKFNYYFNKYLNGILRIGNCEVYLGKKYAKIAKNVFLNEEEDIP